MKIEYLEYIISGLVFIIYMILNIIRISNIKNKVKNEELNKEINEQLVLLIQEAETIFENGLEKKEFVLESIEKIFKKQIKKINIEDISKKIEEIIGITKSINYKEENSEK